MKVEKGMYVRTRFGIGKITELNAGESFKEGKFHFVDKNGREMMSSFNEYVFESDITKASNDIIDLIELGDYVNGSRVMDINKQGEFVIIGYGMEGTIYPNKIKSIVTKEQFERMKYEI